MIIILLSLFIIRKYKNLIYLNVENTFKTRQERLEKNPIYINYLQNKRMIIIRNFLFIYSIFLVSLQFNSFIYKSELEFKIRQNPIYFLMLDSNYDNFFI